MKMELQGEMEKKRTGRINGEKLRIKDNDSEEQRYKMDKGKEMK